VASDLFEVDSPGLALAPGALLLRGFALAEASSLLTDVTEVAARAPFRQLRPVSGSTRS